MLDRDDIFNLVCYRADDVDDAFAFAEGQFDVAVKDADASRKMEQNAAKRRVIPRSVNPDGSLSMAHPHDWCSGFFGGFVEVITGIPWRVESQLPDCFAIDIPDRPHLSFRAQKKIKKITLKLVKTCSCDIKQPHFRFNRR